MADRIQVRRDTAANWTSANPTLAQGEIGYETDTDKVKIGDGTTAWTSLGYVIDTGAYLQSSDIGSTVQAYSSVLQNTTASFTTADETKLDGIEAGADVTDTANVTAAGALMDSELTDIASVKALNQGVATTDSPSFAGLTTADSVARINIVDTDNALGAGGKLTFFGANRSDLDEEMAFIGGSLVTNNGGSGNVQAGDLFLGTSGSERLRVASGGNVGIGTSSPQSNLHVESSGVANAQLTSTENNANLLVQAADGYASRLWLGDTSDYDVGSIQYLHTGDAMTFTVNASERLRITSGGNVGIGTSSPSTLLHVNGNTTLGGGITETVYALSGTTPALDPSNGTVQTWTLSGNSTPTDSLSAGEAITLMIDDGTAYTITWPTITWVNNGGSAPTLATTGYTVIALWKVSTTLYGALVGDGS